MEHAPGHALRRRRLAGLIGLPWLVAAAQAAPAAPRPHWLVASRAVPGGAVELPLGPDERAPEVRWGELPVLVLGDPSGWSAIVGIPLSTAPGPITLNVTRAGRAASPIVVRVQPANYAEQRLKVPPRQVDLSPTDLARHERERRRIAEIVAIHSPRPPTTLHMAAPVPGPRSSSFGLRRVFNGKPRSPHSGMDIAAPLGTPVRCPLAGTVVETADHFFSGRCVWMDHGGGLLTLYAHLDGFDTEAGRSLATGDPIGRVGATGRVTGPHLHWSVLLNQTTVDPALFLAA